MTIDLLVCLYTHCTYPGSLFPLHEQRIAALEVALQHDGEPSDKDAFGKCIEVLKGGKGEYRGFIDVTGKVEQNHKPGKNAL